MLHHLPFAIYRLPDEKTIRVVAQNNPVLHFDFNTYDKGFLFHPFVEDKIYKRIFIRADIAATSGQLPPLDFYTGTSSSTVYKKRNKSSVTPVNKKEFLQLINKIQKQIAEGSAIKVVAARTIQEKKHPSFDTLKLFKSLCRAYPKAFVSLVYTQRYGIWIGASPELLLQVNKEAFTTYSLAGSKANTVVNRHAKWSSKEIQEQQIVSDYITKVFSNFTNKKPRTTKAQTVKAGNLLHLLSTFHYSGIPFEEWKNVALTLHPTPAVAGYPMKEAVHFITKHEKENRAFYSGFLGEVNINQSVKLFVNLRCMQIRDKSLQLYAGCGITSGSVAEDEWNETDIKLQTILRLL